MFERDADGAREATEQGKRNMRFKDLMDSIYYELNDCQKFGQSHASYKLNEEDIKEFLDDVIEALQAHDYQVTFEHPYLNISWVLAEE
ncbi:TPA: hypothetical protein ACSA7L_000229 [Yersinia enterocolitica]|uniref:hypothetical protein n=1 Tax=Yersinia enterocolitica TaxID=630 RepID=UPI00202D867B|nr:MULTISPECIES: hypothetical protein [Enterobacterales]EKN5140914.1 hypothetical protein [Yersinia enterocolitica]ELI7899246.1 hypothetical protein [Yersinia enterocolitica]ELI8002768.1 hypothetical protein [Yersinia enterocolitica]ELW8959039.1 hypothetical protein [Yersinia enterocolitica]ELX2214277.1 hypothetical protein [Yersinia enterocolitica]